jgi:ankyrin repeat protein
MKGGLSFAVLERGGDANVRTLATGNTPLHRAVVNESAECVELLVLGADETLVNNMGETALDVAVRLAATAPSDELAVIVQLLRSATS